MLFQDAFVILSLTNFKNMAILLFFLVKKSHHLAFSLYILVVNMLGYLIDKQASLGTYFKELLFLVITSLLMVTLLMTPSSLSIRMTN